MTLEEELLKNALAKHLLTGLPDNIESYSKVLAFFLIFSRFEYALKCAKFISPDDRKNAKPDWNDFSKKIDNHLTNRKNECRELADAIDYLNNTPPRRQIVRNGTLGWKAVKPHRNDTDGLIESVKRIRNNLFHGGKYPLDLDRDIRLISCATIVLKHLLELESAVEVRDYYYNR